MRVRAYGLQRPPLPHCFLCLPDRFELVAVNATCQTFQTFLTIIKASRICGLNHAGANAGESW